MGCGPKPVATASTVSAQPQEPEPAPVRAVKFGSYDEKPGGMFDLRIVEYPVWFANLQRNNHLEVPTEAKGTLAWKKTFSEMQPGEMFWRGKHHAVEKESWDRMVFQVPTQVLVSGGNIGVASSEHLFLFNPMGKLTLLTSAGGGGTSKPVVFGNRAFAYTDDIPYLMVQEYGGTFVLNQKTFPFLDTWSGAFLLLPREDELIAVVQYTGGPQRNPKKHYIYKRSFNENDDGFAWVVERQGSLTQALLTEDEKTILLVQGSRVISLDTEDGKEIRSFDSGFSESATAILDLSGNIVVAGRKAGRSEDQWFLACFDQSGKSLWEHSLSVELGTNRSWHMQPPAAGMNDRIYIVEGHSLQRLDSGQVVWRQRLQKSESHWLTVTSNEWIITLSGPVLEVFRDDGTRIFRLALSLPSEFENKRERFSAPVAVDALGKLYVASSNGVYCIE